MPDALFADPLLASLYDRFEGHRADLDSYEVLLDDLGLFAGRPGSVLDVGCGTGALACRLAVRGIDVVGVDPAEASLRVANAKPGADRVRWLLGDATTLPALSVDVAVMTGNVAQVFVEDEAWVATLSGVRRALQSGGRFVFETRDPAFRAWEGWHRDATFQRAAFEEVGTVETWIDLLDVDLPYVTFRGTYRFEDGREVTSESTLRFRDRGEIEASLTETGFSVDEVRGAPDRPGREFVFVTTSAEVD